MDTSKNKIVTKTLAKNELCDQLSFIGVKAGMALEVHSSLSSIGYIIGGEETLNDALLQVLGEGTLVMACQASKNSEPLQWEDNSIDFRLMDKIRTVTPGYNPETADISSMGRQAENLRNRANTFFSYHPNSGFMANGKEARALMASQPLNFPLATGSPLDKMYHHPNSYILLIGVGYSKATGLHFGECMSKTREIILQGGSVIKDGQTSWKKYLDYQLDSSEFEIIGKLMEKNRMVKVGKLGEATCRLFKFKDACDITCAYLQQKYGGVLC